MAEPVVKEMTITVKSVQLSDRTTSRGGKIYNIGFEVGGMGNRAVTFSETISAELEKFIDKEVKVEMETREFNGMPSYTIKKANDVATSGFKKGGGFQKDVVSIERQKSADIAEKLLQHMDADQLGKDPLKTWIKTADKVYQWISSRPVEAQASGGTTEQKSDINLDDIPFD